MGKLAVDDYRSLVSKVDKLVEGGARDAGKVLMVLRAIENHPDFFELLGGGEVLGRLSVGNVVSDRLTPIRSLILSPDQQIEAWAKANKKFEGSRIPKTAFKVLDSLPVPALTPEDVVDGYLGPALFYGFGGKDNMSNMILSAKVPLEYIASTRVTWKWKCADFNNPKALRPFVGVHSERPMGFYWKLVHLGHKYQGISVKDARRLISQPDWGMGPEGIQFFLTHPHCAELVNGVDIPYMDLPDFEAVSPYWIDLSQKFTRALCVGFDGDSGKLVLFGSSVSSSDPGSGSGTLR